MKHTKNKTNPMTLKKITAGLAIAGIAALVTLAVGNDAQALGKGPTDEPLQTVAKVDLNRYLGNWYEVARLPNRFEKNCICATANYSLRNGETLEGGIKVVNTCRKESNPELTKSVTGKAWVSDTETNAKLKVMFFWPFRGDYWVIELGDNYEYAVVGEPKRGFLWILSRTQKMEQPVLDGIYQRLQTLHGYDISNLITDVQKTADVCPADNT